MVTPRYGFAARDPESRQLGEERPTRLYASRVFFASAGNDADAREPILRAGDGTSLSLARFSRRGELAVVNNGRNRGFLYCRDCGFAELQSSRATKKKPGPHQHPVNSQRQCWGMRTRVDLGHTFMTDIVELVFPLLPMPAGFGFPSACESITAALTRGAARTLNARGQDIAGTYYLEGGHPVFVLYDDVPGGAGLARAAYDRIADVVAAAVALCESCTCGESSSCYGCLRTYGNQFEHENLNRSLVVEAFRPLLSALSESI